MNRLPTMDKANTPRRTTAFDMARNRAESELAGLDEALRVVEQKRSYDGGQIDLFPQELLNESSLFGGVIEVIKEK